MRVGQISARRRGETNEQGGDEESRYSCSVLRRTLGSFFLPLLLASCAATASRAPTEQPSAVLPAEAPFLSDLRQLTFGGENAEAYWSFQGDELSFQARGVNDGCDRIYRM